MTSRRRVLSITLADCEIQTFSVGGHGGAGKDTSNSGVRLIHTPSGARGEGRAFRSQLANKRAAFLRMIDTPTFKGWLRVEHARRCGLPSVEHLVDQAMDPAHLRVEGRNAEGRWVCLD